MKEYKLAGNEFCDFEKVDAIPGMPSISNFKFGTKRKVDPITGSGIYSIYYDSILLYVGEYNGKTKKGLKDPFSGSVTDRWYKHIALLTGRSNRIYFNKTNLDKIKKMENCELKNLILEGDPKVLVPPKERGHNYHFNKFKFSAENWDDFKNFDAETLKRFTFCYRQYIPSDFDTSDLIAIRKIVGRVETTIINKLRPRCNAYVTDPSAFNMDESLSIIKEEMTKVQTSAIHLQ